MEKKYMERLVGKYCKIVTKEPGEDRATVVIGTLEDVDYKDGFVLVDSAQGLGCLRIDTIIAIKPKYKEQYQGKHKKYFKKDESGMVGIGTLIVFIAMVLISAVAASLLIQTTDTLQQSARTIGTQTIKEVSTGLEIVDITGYTNENRTTLNYLALTIRPRPGSKDVDLSLCELTVLYENLTVLILDRTLVSPVNLDNKSVFNTPVNSTNASYRRNNTIIGHTTSTKFGIISIHDPDGSVTRTNGINSGDRVFIMVNLSAICDNNQKPVRNQTTGNITTPGSWWNESGLPARQSISGTFTPETGSKASFDITAPAVFTKRIVPLW